MRLVSYRRGDALRSGALLSDLQIGDRLLDLGAGGLEVLLAEPDGLADARSAVAAAAIGELPPASAFPLVAPVRPGTMLCLGYNYRGHVPIGADPSASDPAYPDVFVKTPNTLAGPTDPVVLPRAATDVDYEGEIALVIGRVAHDVPLESALEYVAGYTLFNDVSDREWQGRSSQWELGKCFDGFGPLGPALVTADEIVDPHDLTMQVERDGIITVLQSTSTMIFPMAFLVQYLSTVMTLKPGDIISTGTPQKLPEAMAAHRPLADGDAVTIRVAGLGELTTTFVAPSPTPNSPGGTA